MRFIRVWWHCLTHTLRLHTDHRMVRLHRGHFCECGYPDVPEPVMRYWLDHTIYRKPHGGCASRCTRWYRRVSHHSLRCVPFCFSRTAPSSRYPD